MSDGSTASEIYIGLGGGGAPGGPRQSLVLKRANRHGLIAGATGTGKTVTLQGLAEGFSAVGVPVFVADVKGDLAGMAMAGSPTAKTHEIFAARAAEIGDGEWAYRDNPVIFWDLFGEQGHPVRTTISEMGPLLLARLMGLNEVQEGVLAIAFRVADEQNLLLLDLGDLQAMLAWCAESADELTTKYGNVSKATVGTIQRQLLTLESQGGANFFGEPALDIMDMIRTDENGSGYVNILAADRLMASPKLYATFLLWMLSEMFETLPEVGDPDKPKLVFFFDEAHLLFDGASKAFLQQVEQTVKLIRSKGVGVFFCTQLPTDVPNDVLSQLGARVQHALRAFTPDDQKALSKTVRTYPKTKVYDLESALTSLGIGEAIITVLSEKGAPTPVAWTRMRAPRSLMDTIGPDAIRAAAAASPLQAIYGQTIDRESAYERLTARLAPPQPLPADPLPPPLPVPGGVADAGGTVRSRGTAEPSLLEKMAASPAFKSAMRSAGTVIGREITRSIFGTGRRRRR